ncbi:MAG: RsmB/NOP family class I SAM-dependent RNA methyltransferase, partial [Clostridia bacterium]|nr:RsmB/NOP family class I SAM-dependent RNA methyltransferase [Clostridia bacterium]
MLPKEYIANLKALQGFDYDAYQTALCAPPTRGLHVNLCKGSTGHVPALICEEWQEHALTPLSYSEDCFLVESEKSVGQLPLHHAGAYYMQEPSAMTPVCCLALKKGMRVLDLCAAPGGKSTQIANKIGESGLLVSNEIHPGRCAILAGNIERMGIRHAVVTHTDAQNLAQYLPHYFDAIVVDAPCSGEGMFRKTPEAIEEWQESSPLFCAKRQKEILSHAAKMLKSGGCLVSSTCTFS